MADTAISIRRHVTRLTAWPEIFGGDLGWALILRSDSLMVSRYVRHPPKTLRNSEFGFNSESSPRYNHAVNDNTSIKGQWGELGDGLSIGGLVFRGPETSHMWSIWSELCAAVLRSTQRYIWVHMAIQEIGLLRSVHLLNTLSEVGQPLCLLSNMTFISHLVGGLRLKRHSLHVCVEPPIISVRQVPVVFIVVLRSVEQRALFCFRFMHHIEALSA